MYKIILSANRHSLTSSFQIRMAFVSLSCLIALTRISITLLNRRGESGTLDLFLILEKKLQPFTFSILLVASLSHVAFFYGEVHSSYTHFVEIVYHQRILNFVNFFYIC